MISSEIHARDFSKKKWKKKEACARTWTESTHVVQIARPAAHKNAADS